MLVFGVVLNIINMCLDVLIVGYIFDYGEVIVVLVDISLLFFV